MRTRSKGEAVSSCRRSEESVMTSRARIIASASLGIVTLLGGCAGTTTGLTPSATVTTAIIGWESRMSLDWELTGQDISGYVNNKYGSHFINVQLLAQGLDANGNVVGHKLEWLQGMVPA